MVGKYILNPTGSVEGFVMKTKPDFPDGSLIVRKHRLAFQCISIKQKVLIGLLIFFDPVLKLVVGCRYFLGVKKLGLFPVTKVQLNLIFFPGKHQS